ncbi:MAG: NTP transferase domain-containing protein [Candidatus Aenigmarchaeota archaeon]|nr:NTP transferase domain-containing protein [Candidatus Aenigmarchaeota archaeon]
MTIKRITVTIKPEHLKRIDGMVGKAGIRNRSHAVEQLLLKSMSKNDLDTVIVLAGGEGVSLRPITYEIPKPLIPIHGKPVLEHQIAMLEKHGIKHIILAVGYMKDKIKEYFGHEFRGMSIDYAEEDKPLGTGGPLLLAKKYIKSTVAVMNVDTLMEPDIQKIYEFHRDQGRLATILLVTSSDPQGLGVAKINGNVVTEFVEKPKKAKSNLVNAGFYIIEPELLRSMPKGRFMLEDFFNQLAKKGQLSGFVYDEEVFDIGTHAGYARAIKEWKPHENFIMKKTR